MKMITALLAVVLAVSMVLVGVTSSAPYDPWIDLDDDGDIDIFDIVKMAGAYGTSGTPINKTELLLELAAGIEALNATVAALEEQIVGLPSCEVRIGTQTGTGGFTVSFSSSFPNGTIPEVFAVAVLTLDDPGPSNLLKGMCPYPQVSNPTNTGFDVLLKDQVGGVYMLTATADVYYIAIATESTSTPKPKHCAETAVQCTTQFWTPPPASLNSDQIKVDFPVTFTNASNVELSASGIGVTGSCAGSPLRITAINVTATYAILTLQGWNGSAWTNLDAGDEVEISYVAIEKLSS